MPISYLILHMTPLKNQAIQAALMGNWDEAITANKELLKAEPHDIDTLNRLAFAFTVIGQTKNAKDTYKKVLDLDTKNPIAIKNLIRLVEGAAQKNGEHSENNVTIQAISYNTGFTNNMFLEESGKTKVIDLVNIADLKTISHLRTGESVCLQVKRSKIFAIDNNKQYVGMLPDDISTRLIKLLNGGNTYESYIKAVQNNKVTIFVKETKRSSRFKNQPSFTSHSKKAFMENNNQTKNNSQTTSKSDDTDSEEE